MTIASASAQAQTYGGQSTDDLQQMEMLQREFDQQQEAVKRENDRKARKQTWSFFRYQNVGYVFDETAEFEDENGNQGAKQEVDWGASLQFGNSYSFPSSSILGFMRFGFDVTWLDLSFVKYKDQQKDFVNAPASRSFELPDWITGMEEKSGHFSAGVGLGFSLHVAPFAKLGSALKPFRIHGFGRVVPSYSCVLYPYENSTYATGTFVPFFTYGAQVDYKGIGLGVEFRTGQANYDFDYENGYYEETITQKIKINSSRVFVSFHF